MHTLEKMLRDDNIKPECRYFTKGHIPHVHAVTKQFCHMTKKWSTKKLTEQTSMEAVWIAVYGNSDCWKFTYLSHNDLSKP